MLECVVNVSEGHAGAVLDAIAAAAGGDLLDVHRDEHHNRAVLTLVGEEAPRAVGRVAVERLDLRVHEGAHPRLGTVDVVPFVPLAGAAFAVALAARDAFAAWAADELAVPCFLYGPERTLPEVRRTAWRPLRPDTGPAAPHPTAGAMCVGARDLLVAYNVWLAEPDVELARRVALEVRGPDLRALGLTVGGRAQVSMNLIAPTRLGPADAYAKVAALAPVAGAELVGLVPEAVLARIPSAQWGALDLAAARTIEARLAARGASGQPAVRP